MLDPSGARKALDKLFTKEKVADLPLLFKTVGTRSRMSVFRRMNDLGYITSYTHAGRYYTLKRIPDFDSMGLWFHGDKGFSRMGTLKATVSQFIEKSSCGMRPSELHDIVRLEGPNALYNTLGELVKRKQISRHRMERGSLYTSARSDRTREQVEQYQQKMSTESERAEPLPASEIIISVLVEALQASQALVVPKKIARRLQAQSMEVTTEQVEQVLHHYGLNVEKKTAGRPWQPSPP